MGPLNQFTFCRLCLCTSSSLMNLFDEGNIEGLIVKETIEDLCQFKVVRVHGCPWLTCDSCREKLNDFRRFKINCIESKVAFENRFPQQIVLMPGGISISTNPAGQPQALLLLPVSSMPAFAGNVNSFQMTPQSFSGISAPNCNQFISCCNGINTSKPNINLGAFPSAEEGKTNENLPQTKIEPMEVQQDLSVMDSVDSKRDMPPDIFQPSIEIIEDEIEEKDEKNFLLQENCMEPIVAFDRGGTNGSTEVQIEGMSDRLMDRENTIPRGTLQSTNTETEKPPMPAAMNEKSFSTTSEEGNESHFLNGEGVNHDSSFSSPAPSVPPFDSFLCRSLVHGKSAAMTPVYEPSKANLPTAAALGADKNPVINSINNAENVSVLPVFRFEESLSKCLFPAVCNPPEVVPSECNNQNPQDVTPEQDIIPGDETKRQYLLDSYECAMCFEIYDRPEFLATHKLTHNNDPRPYKCTVCSRTYRNRKNQIMHIKSHYNVPNRFECHLCHVGFQYRHHLKRHIKSHTVKTNYPCRICGEVFRTSHLRGRHQVRHSGPQHACPHCGRTYYGRGELNNHMKIHGAEKKYMCDICGKAFSKMAYLRYHQQVHDEEKRHVCKECGAKFAQYAALWQHKKWHQGNKQFVCDVCGKGFVLNCQLRQHKKCHLKTLKRASRKAKSKKKDDTDENSETNGAKKPEGATELDCATESCGQQEGSKELESATECDSQQANTTELNSAAECDRRHGDTSEFNSAIECDSQQEGPSELNNATESNSQPKDISGLSEAIKFDGQKAGSKELNGAREPDGQQEGSKELNGATELDGQLEGSKELNGATELDDHQGGSKEPSGGGVELDGQKRGTTEPSSTPEVDGH